MNVRENLFIFITVVAHSTKTQESKVCRGEKWAQGCQPSRTMFLLNAIQFIELPDTTKKSQTIAKTVKMVFTQNLE